MFSIRRFGTAVIGLALVSTAAASLKIHFRFDQTDTTALHTDVNQTSPTLVSDSSGNGINGLFRDGTGGGDANKAVVAPGTLTGGFDFDGDDIVEFLVGTTGVDGKASLTGNNARTFAFWVRPDTFGDKRMISYAGGSAAGSFFGLTLESDTTGNHVKFRRGSGFQTYYPAQATNPIALGAYVHIVLVVPEDATQTTDLEIYVNGVQANQVGDAVSLVTSSSQAGVESTLDDNDYVGIGMRGVNADAGTPVGGGSQNGFDGVIADFQFYTTALSASDISVLFDNPGFTVTGGGGEVWTGGGADSNWGTAANWQDGAPDFAAGEALLRFPASAKLNPNNEAAGRTLDSILFDTNAQAYLLLGQPFTVTNQISNLSANMQTIAAPVISDGATLSAKFADLTLISLEAATNSTLGADSNNTLTTGSITGAGDLTLNGLGRVTLPGDNAAFTGDIIMPRDDNTILRVAHDDALGDTTGTTTVGTGPNFWVEFLGNITVPEHLQVVPKNGDVNTQCSLVNVSGDNTLSGIVSLVKHPTATGTRAITFRIDSGSLTLANPISFELDGLDEQNEIIDGGPRIRVYGATDDDNDALILMGNVTDDAPHRGDPTLDQISLEVEEGATVILNGTNNPYSGLTHIADDTSKLILNGVIPQTSPIELSTDGATLDATGISGLELQNGQRLEGRGRVLGGLTANSGTTIAPEIGDLDIEGDLTLNDGAEVDVELSGSSAGLLNVQGGQLTGSGVTTIVLTPTAAAVNNATPIITAPAGITLTKANFNLVLNDPSGFLNAVSLRVTATEVQVVTLASLHCSDFDFDLDEYVDDYDVDRFMACVAGPDNDVPPPSCTPDEFAQADSDFDSDVDLKNYAAFQQNYGCRTRPNVILVLMDDMGWSDFGCYGSEIHTPTIDSLAANGLRFRDFYNAARCSPTRCAIMTGQYTQRVAVDPGASLPNLRTDNNVTIAEVLAGNGYRTYMSGKWHLGRASVNRDPISRGFQHAYGHHEDAAGAGGQTFWDKSVLHLVSTGNEIEPLDFSGEQFHNTDAFSDYVLTFIDHHNSKHDDKRFFVYLPLMATHWPIEAPADIADHYTDVGDDDPDDVDYYHYEDGYEVTRAERYARQLAIDAIDPNYVLSPRRDHPAPVTPIPDWDTLSNDRQNDMARRMAVFAAMLEQVDQNIAKIVNKLEQSGQLNNTLIMICADNGGNYEGGIWGDPSPRTNYADLRSMGQPGDIDIFGRVEVGGAWANVSNTPYKLFKHFTHEGGIRTPLIVHWPDGMDPSVMGTWTNDRAHIIDIPPTVLDAAGAAYPLDYAGRTVHPADGTSLTPLFAGQHLAPRDIAVEHESNRAFYRDGYKFTTKNFAYSDGTSPANEFELYDMQADPAESDNLATTLPSKLRELMDAWNDWALDVGVPSNRLLP